MFEALNRGDVDMLLLCDGDFVHCWRGAPVNSGGLLAWRLSASECIVLPHAPDTEAMFFLWEKLEKRLRQELGEVKAKEEPPAAAARVKAKAGLDLVEAQQKALPVAVRVLVVFFL